MTKHKDYLGVIYAGVCDMLSGITITPPHQLRVAQSHVLIRHYLLQSKHLCMSWVMSPVLVIQW